jgi:hypothetical protein
MSAAWFLECFGLHYCMCNQLIHTVCPIVTMCTVRTDVDICSATVLFVMFIGVL